MSHDGNSWPSSSCHLRMLDLKPETLEVLRVGFGFSRGYRGYIRFIGLIGVIGVI